MAAVGLVDKLSPFQICFGDRADSLHVGMRGVKDNSGFWLCNWKGGMPVWRWERLWQKRSFKLEVCLKTKTYFFLKKYVNVCFPEEWVQPIFLRAPGTEIGSCIPCPMPCPHVLGLCFGRTGLRVS